MKRNRVIAACITALLLSGCGAQPNTEEAAAVTETVTEIESVSETAALSAAVTEASEEITDEAPQECSWVLDRTASAYELFQADDTATACLLGEPSENITVWGAFCDESRRWKDPLISIESEMNEYVIIEHDGVLDEVPVNWTTRFLEDPPEFELIDADRDGSDELVMIRYYYGGTACMLEELTVFKSEDGHYVKYIPDEQHMLADCVTAEMDKDTGLSVLRNKDGSIEYACYSPHCAGVEDELIYGTVIDYYVSDGQIYQSLGLYRNNTASWLCALNRKIDFKDGAFTCTDIGFDYELEPDDISTVEEVTISEDARAAYKEYLDGNGEVYGVCFEDMNNDGTAEMIVGTNPFGLCRVISFGGGELKILDVDVVSVWGGTWAIRDDWGRNVVLNQEQYGSTYGAAGYQCWNVYTWDDDRMEYTAAFRYEREGREYIEGESSLEDCYGQAYLNGEPIDEAKSSLILKALTLLSEQNSGFDYVVRCDDDGNVTDEYTSYITEYLG
ncbi:MAG: hypothetical protein ACI4XF_02370 [Oscillospiraceae bacterium]